jgi:uncharacterized FlaG/YvyC family protein
MDPKVLEEAATKLNSANAVGSENEIVVSVSGHRLDVQVVNRETRQVIEQISPPSILRMLRKLPRV